MPGLKLNHVSKRGHWYVLPSNNAFLVWLHNGAPNICLYVCICFETYFTERAQWKVYWFYIWMMSYQIDGLVLERRSTITSTLKLRLPCTKPSKFKRITRITLLHNFFLHTALNAQMAKFMGQHEAHLGPIVPRWAPCWPQEPCYHGYCS